MIFHGRFLQGSTTTTSLISGLERQTAVREEEIGKIQRAMLECAACVGWYRFAVTCQSCPEFHGIDTEC
jgi:hypothetical protein